MAGNIILWVIGYPKSIKEGFQGLVEGGPYATPRQLPRFEESLLLRTCGTSSSGYTVSFRKGCLFPQRSAIPYVLIKVREGVTGFAPEPLLVEG